MHKSEETFKASADSRRKIKNDMIFICSLLLIALAAALVLFLSRTAGDTVTVTVDGELFGEYSLSEDRTVEIRNGNGYNRLIIREGFAYVEIASCPDGICSAHRPINKSGESIICLPNRVVITVRSQDGSQPDIIV